MNSRSSISHRSFVVTSYSPLGPYRVRRFRSRRVARWFVNLRSVFYLMGNPIPTWVTLREEVK